MLTANRAPIYHVKANEKLFRMQKKFGFDKKVFLGKCLNLDMFPKFEDILRIFSVIMGKYGILDENLWGLKG